MKKYWKSLEEYHHPDQTVEIQKAEALQKNAVIDLLENAGNGKSSRRNFLKAWGFSLASATVVAACERPVQKAIPFLNRPEEITPGKALHYATTFYDGEEYASIVVKNRDGRPIKIEGNTLSSLTRGGTSAVSQASLLSLYDLSRIKHPLKKGSETDWDQADEEISFLLNNIRNEGGKVVVLSASVISPATRSVIHSFLEGFENRDWVELDPLSVSAIADAHQENFGHRIVPDYRFDKAKLVVSFGADFLGTWIAPVTFTKRYSSLRKPDADHPEMSRHIQYEATMSLTGSKADERHRIRPSEEIVVLANIYNALAWESGLDQVETPDWEVESLVAELKDYRGRSLVISGSNNLQTQLLVNAINSLLGNYGKTIDTGHAWNIRQGDDRKWEETLNSLDNGEVSAIFVYNLNPVYLYPDGNRVRNALKKAGLKVSFSSFPDETGAEMDFVCPDHHFLENWGDAEPVTGHFSLAQPVIRPLFDTRPAQESFLKWSGKDISWESFLKNFWKENILTTSPSFEKAWQEAVQKGVYETSAALQDMARFAPSLKTLEKIPSPAEGTEMVLFAGVATRSGTYANNPWLQELPDPITKLCWDNAVMVSPALAEKLQLKNEEMITLNGLELPVVIQPGQEDNTLSIAVGYGRQNTGKVADNAGFHVYPLMEIRNGYRSYSRNGLKPEKTGRTYTLALTQMHHSMEGRPIVQELSLDEYRNGGHVQEGHHGGEDASLYKEPEFPGFHWGMAIDLNACTACAACVVACQTENNIPVVGKEEVRKTRIMHWIRIDRYYSDDPQDPDVFHQPVMCQHCDNAPCENVCPVAATMHNDEGLNQVAYNRCIGTKYCINNCPYRVRRFNWFRYVDNPEFDYNMNNDLSKLVLNPDVTVRERGVVEKCTFCVQRIQEKKLEAKLENRPLRDGEILPACVQGCPSEALVFGDLNDPESRVSKIFKSNRNYYLLEELHTLPSVGYQTLVRNRKKPARGHV